MTTVQRMREAARRLRDSLHGVARQRGVAPFGVGDRREWSYLPGPRPGVALVDLDPVQRELVMALLDTALSSTGSRTAREVMELDGVLRELERERGASSWRVRHPLHYWVRVLGDPEQDVWGWSLGGHHLTVAVTVVGDRVAATPQFFGANPAVVREGPRAGWQVLRAEEQGARDLLGLLDADQRRVAVVADEAPSEIATRHDPVADASRLPRGIAMGDLERDQRGALERLVHCYLDRAAEPVAAAAWRSVVDGGLEDLTFAWSGSTEMGRPHYYALRGSTFLVEYDNTQDDANHVHTVWRDLRGDWGEDLLAQHHASATHHH